MAVETRDYINGIEYKGGILDRFAHTEGAVVLQSGTTYSHEYTIKDHLGNTRVTYSDANNDGTITATDIKQINHYYPFGMNADGNWNGGANGTNKYQYNGKEFNSDFGLNWNDYGARFYTSDAPRWVNVDPLSELRANLSPYQYVQNNPINSIDPTGMLDESFYAMGNGKSVKQVGEDVQVAAERGDFNRNNQKSGTKATPYGTRTYVNGKLISETVEGYNLIEDNDCGCPNPPCGVSEEFKAKHPNREPFGFFEYLWTGGNIDGAHYSRNGKLYGYAPQMGMPPIIGGPLRKGDKILKIGQYLFNPKTFHRIIKPDILGKAANYAHIVGDNPDIVIKGTKILLSGAKSGPFAGKTIETGLSILDFIF